MFVSCFQINLPGTRADVVNHWVANLVITSLPGPSADGLMETLAGACLSCTGGAQHVSSST